MGTGWGSWVATRLSSYGEVEFDKNNINASIPSPLADPCLCQRAPLDQLGCGGGQGGPLRSAGGGEPAHHQPGHEIMITNSPSLSNLSDIFVSFSVTLWLSTAGELPHDDADVQRQLSQREAWGPRFQRLQVIAIQLEH